jgi:ELWxxDGT repeat protein
VLGLRPGYRPIGRSVAMGVAAAMCCLAISGSPLGAAVGPRMVKNVNPGAADSFPSGFVKAGSRVFFSADNGQHGYELWRTDGTAAGTKMVKDINPGPASSEPDSMVALNGILYFVADDGEHGYELWRSDGTAAGTRMVKDINRTPPGSVSAVATLGSEPSALGRVGSVLYFYANNGTHGRELWRSTGTARSTRMLADINPGQASSQWCCYTPFGGGNSIMFEAKFGSEYELWRSDGGPATTSRVTGLGNNPTATHDVAGGRFWYALDSVEDTLFVTDGTQTLDLGTFSQVLSLAYVNGKIVFVASRAATGRELYVSDGTPTGTGLLTEIVAGPDSSSPRFWHDRAVNGRLLFHADDGVHGRELWATDGTADGTDLVEDINPAPGADSGDGSNYRDVIGNRLYFVADDGTSGEEPWVSDGTPGGTHMLKQIAPGAASSFPTDGAVLNGVLYFTAENATHGRELWRTNGTSAGTRMLLDINPGSGDSSVSGVTAAGGAVYFSAATAAAGEEPWRYVP